VPGKSDRDQLLALRRPRAAFGEVQVLAVHPSEIEGEPAGRSPASQQLALTLPAPPSGRSTPPDPSNARLP
jgi:hypothetical protein